MQTKNISENAILSTFRSERGYMAAASPVGPTARVAPQYPPSPQQSPVRSLTQTVAALILPQTQSPPVSRERALQVIAQLPNNELKHLMAHVTQYHDTICQKVKKVKECFQNKQWDALREIFEGIDYLAHPEVAKRDVLEQCSIRLGLAMKRAVFISDPPDYVGIAALTEILLDTPYFGAILDDRLSDYFNAKENVNILGLHLLLCAKPKNNLQQVVDAHCLAISYAIRRKSNKEFAQFITLGELSYFAQGRSPQGSAFSFAHYRTLRKEFLAKIVALCASDDNSCVIDVILSRMPKQSLASDMVDVFINMRIQSLSAPNTYKLIHKHFKQCTLTDEEKTRLGFLS